jgi:hypothetical protein
MLTEAKHPFGNDELKGILRRSAPQYDKGKYSET